MSIDVKKVSCKKAIKVSVVRAVWEEYIEY